MYKLEFQWRLDESGQRVLTINNVDQPWVVSWNKSADKVRHEHGFEIDRDGGDSPRQRVITHWLFVGDQPTEYGVQKVGLSAWSALGRVGAITATAGG